MNTDFESATFARRHGDWSAAVRDAWHTVAVSLAALHRRQFDAPWKSRGTRRVA
ncbi:hypothetical protein [Sphingomonas corticis]|jgi:hypothetical protein|uniref:Uncharacterized protein n=1 Tax=Sphingomonas corticis TaxID=2722791 RepID=A0ABX1CU51_9SPHN|nr:hypothetical protein [Sphingomonas corticis]NJR79927.1 hypothetical protein [Sphingomonas corticis]